MAVSPLRSLTITQQFGVKNSAYRLGYHPGTDYRAKTPTPERAVTDGYVRYYPGYNGGYGNVNALFRSNGDVIWYAHQSKSVKTGNVKTGDIIGYTGATGWVTAPHLHIEYRIKGDKNRPIDFADWLRTHPEPKPAPKPKFKLPAKGKTFKLSKGITRTTFKNGTTKVAGHIRVKDNSYIYVVRGVDKKYKNRVVINSKSAGGNGVSLALYYTNGKRIEGWK